MYNKKLFIINFYGLESQKKKLVEELDELKEAINENNLEHQIEEMADVLNVIQQIIIKLDCEPAILKMQEYKLDRQIERINKSRFVFVDKKEKKEKVSEKEYPCNHWSELMTECYKRLQEGKGCSDCDILPRLETIDIETCDLKFKVRELVRKIGKPKAKSSFFGVDMTNLMSETLNHILNTDNLTFNDLTNSEKSVIPDLYMIGLNYGFSPKHQTKRFNEFVKFVKEHKSEVIN